MKNYNEKLFGRKYIKLSRLPVVGMRVIRKKVQIEKKTKDDRYSL